MLRHIQMRRVTNTYDNHHVYQTLYPPFAASSTVSDYVFGGVTVAIALQAGYNSANENVKHRTQQESCKKDWIQWYPLTMQGSFFGPLKVGSPVYLKVESNRSTRNFLSYTVRVFEGESSEQKIYKISGLATFKVRAMFFIDFCQFDLPHFRHPITGEELFFHEQIRRISVLREGPTNGLKPSEMEIIHRGKGAGYATEQYYLAMFDIWQQMVDLRYGVGHRDLKSFFGFLPMNADEIRRIPGGGRDASQEIDYMWIKGHKMLSDVKVVNDEAKSIEGILPIMEYTLSSTFAALNLDPRIAGVSGALHHLKHGTDISSVTLDTSIRFHTHDFSPEEWLLIEVQLKSGNNSRFSGEAKMFNTQGNVIASCMQTCQLIDLRLRKVQQRRGSSSL